jgi:hypothetical protein
MKAVFSAGAQRGNHASVFAIAGDESVLQPGFLAPFANPQGYTLDNQTNNLKGIIDWYTQTAVGGTTSFDRHGAASRAGWTAAQLLDPSQSDPANCQSGETPLACELRLTQPAVVIISVGANDALHGTDLQAFSASMGQIIQTALDNGVIPVVMTIQPRTDGAVPLEQIRSYNDAIIEVAQSKQVPVINIWRAFNSLPDRGLSGDHVTPSVSPTGPGDLTAQAIDAYGMNARNADTLRTLNELRNAIFPKAAP